MTEPYVLVVDDEELLRDMLVRWLTSLGYRSVSVETADEALVAIAAERPIVVIADVVMPIHDGFWLLEEIRARWPDIPVVMSSGATLDNNTVLRARRLRATDFMAKPFARETLNQALQRALDRQGVA